MDTLFRQRRMMVPKRASELVALLAVSSTLFLFLHTRDLTSRLHQMEGRLNEDDYQISARVQTDHIPASLQDYRTMDSIPKPAHLERFGSKRILEQDSDEDDNAENRLSSGPEEGILDPSELNNTRKSDLDVLFFNRVPKVGSQTFMELLRRLAIKNSFGFNRDAVQRMETIRLSPADQELLAGYVASFDAPSAYVKHVCYTNFTKFNYPLPIYINVVRDPVERVISWYYYIRAPWYYVERKRAFPDLPLPDTDWLKKDFESCVLSGDPECRYTQGETRDGIGDHRRQTLFFCGHDHDCLPFNSAASLARAKHAVESQYAVVGVLESFNETLRALQHYVPAFFRGAHDLYWEEMRPYSRINRNAFKPRVSERVKDIVRANFTREIEFYEFCKQRLHRQVRALKLSSDDNY